MENTCICVHSGFSYIIIAPWNLNIVLCKIRNLIRSYSTCCPLERYKNKTNFDTGVLQYIWLNHKYFCAVAYNLVFVHQAQPQAQITSLLNMFFSESCNMKRTGAYSVRFGHMPSRTHGSSQQLKEIPVRVFL